MKKYSIALHNILIFTIFFTSSVYAKFIGQGYVKHGILTLFVISIISAIVGGFLLRLFIRDLTYPRAFFISFAGSIFSVVGWIGGGVILFDEEGCQLELIKAAYGLFKIYWVSSFMEMLAIKLFFSYKLKQLLIPVLIANLITGCMFLGAAMLRLL